MNTKPTTKERIEERRSQVRVYVTYAATIYAFVGSGILIASALWVDTLDATKLTTAKDVFMTVLPRGHRHHHVLVCQSETGGTDADQRVGSYASCFGLSRAAAR